MSSPVLILDRVVPNAPPADLSKLSLSALGAEDWSTEHYLFGTDNPMLRSLQNADTKLTERNVGVTGVVAPPILSPGSMKLNTAGAAPYPTGFYSPTVLAVGMTVCCVHRIRVQNESVAILGNIGDGPIAGQLGAAIQRPGDNRYITGFADDRAGGSYNDKLNAKLLLPAVAGTQFFPQIGSANMDGDGKWLFFSMTITATGILFWFAGGPDTLPFVGPIRLNGGKVWIGQQVDKPLEFAELIIGPARTLEQLKGTATRSFFRMRERGIPLVIR